LPRILFTKPVPCLRNALREQDRRQPLAPVNGGLIGRAPRLEELHQLLARAVVVPFAIAFDDGDQMIQRLFALAFAVAAIWPRARIAMIAYALVIAATRLVLLAHHPSDVVAGALVGITGAMVVRYWFAARRLGFAIHRDGTIVALTGPSSGRLKRVAQGPFAP